MHSIPFPVSTPYARPLYLWQPEGQPRALVLVSHGMAEYVTRYNHLGQALNKAGYLMAGYNHLGHGEEAPIKGYFADQDGWGRTVADLKAIMDWLAAQYPGCKRVLFGHSMGSFLAREYALRYPKGLDALVLSGTGWYPKALCLGGLLPARLLSTLGQAKKPSKMLDKLAFSANNKPFRAQNGTAFDWLSRDPVEVQKYIDSPLCGFVFTARGFADLFSGLLALTQVDRYKVLPASLPVRLMSGGSDPVGANGKGVHTVADQLRAANLNHITVQLYAGARHEIVNETNKQEVIADLIAWLDSQV